MKLFNIFKKESSSKLDSKKTVKSSFKPLDKTQLEKVIGGDGETGFKQMKDSVIQNTR
jgi:bacteriocin-like protein